MNAMTKENKFGKVMQGQLEEGMRTSLMILSQIDYKLCLEINAVAVTATSERVSLVYG